MYLLFTAKIHLCHFFVSLVKFWSDKCFVGISVICCEAKITLIIINDEAKRSMNGKKKTNKPIKIIIIIKKKRFWSQHPDWNVNTLLLNLTNWVKKSGPNFCYSNIKDLLIVIAKTLISIFFCCQAWRNQLLAFRRHVQFHIWPCWFENVFLFFLPPK